MFSKTKKYISAISLAIFLTVPVSCFLDNVQVEAAPPQHQVGPPSPDRPAPPPKHKKAPPKKHKVKPAPHHPAPLPPSPIRNPR